MCRYFPLKQSRREEKNGRTSSNRTSNLSSSSSFPPFSPSFSSLLLASSPSILLFVASSPTSSKDAHCSLPRCGRSPPPREALFRPHCGRWYTLTIPFVPSNTFYIIYLKDGLGGGTDSQQRKAKRLRSADTKDGVDLQYFTALPRPPPFVPPFLLLPFPPFFSPLMIYIFCGLLWLLSSWPFGANRTFFGEIHFNFSNFLQ